MMTIFEAIIIVFTKSRWSNSSIHWLNQSRVFEQGASRGNFISGHDLCVIIQLVYNTPAFIVPCY